MVLINCKTNYLILAAAAAIYYVYVIICLHLKYVLFTVLYIRRYTAAITSFQK